jgi:hypothetical protein
MGRRRALFHAPSEIRAPCLYGRAPVHVIIAGKEKVGDWCSKRAAATPGVGTGRAFPPLWKRGGQGGFF